MTEKNQSTTNAGEIDFLRHLFIPVYLPAILFATGEGALIPVVPLTARSLGASLATAGIISGLLMIGVVVGDIPSGFVVARWGETFAMRAAAVIAIASAVMCWHASHLVLLAAGVLMIGIASATFNLARQAFLTAWTPPWYRARAMSLMGGTSRIGYFIGPFLASPIIAIAGSHSVYWIHVTACIAVLIALQVMPDPEQALSANRANAEAHRDHRQRPDARLDRSTATSLGQSPALAADTAAEPTASGKSGAAPAPDAPHAGTRHRLPIITYFPILIRMGTAAGILQLMRASRQVILPLWGVQLDISPSHIALIMGVAGAVDLSLFYTSGQIGRAHV